METYFLQTLTAGIGSVGFAVLFNIHGRHLALIGIGGAMSWISYVIFMTLTGSPILALFGGTVVVELIAEISARILKRPVITLMVPMLIPLIPGGDLYRSMSHLVSGDMTAFADMSSFALKEAVAIAFGILVVTLCVQIITKTLRYLCLLKPPKNR